MGKFIVVIEDGKRWLEWQGEDNQTRATTSFLEQWFPPFAFSGNTGEIYSNERFTIKILAHRPEDDAFYDSWNIELVETINTAHQ